MKLTDLAGSADNHYDKHHDDKGKCNDEARHFCWALSMNCVPGADMPTLAVTARRPNPVMRVATVGAILAAGWVVDRTPGRADGHTDVYLEGGRRPTDVELAALLAAFGPPMANPAGKVR